MLTRAFLLLLAMLTGLSEARAVGAINVSADRAAIANVMAELVEEKATFRTARKNCAGRDQVRRRPTLLLTRRSTPEAPPVPCTYRFDRPLA